MAKTAQGMIPILASAKMQPFSLALPASIPVEGRNEFVRGLICKSRSKEAGTGGGHRLDGPYRGAVALPCDLWNWGTDTHSDDSDDNLPLEEHIRKFMESSRKMSRRMSNPMESRKAANPRIVSLTMLDSQGNKHAGLFVGSSGGSSSNGSTSVENPHGGGGGGGLNGAGQIVGHADEFGARPIRRAFSRIAGRAASIISRTSS